MSTSLATLQETPKSELVTQLARAKRTLATMREAGKHAGKVMATTGLAAAGGATAGILAVKMPTVPGTNGKVQSDLALAVTLSVLSAADVFDSADEYVNAYAMGLLGAGVARETQKMMIARK